MILTNAFIKLTIPLFVLLLNSPKQAATDEHSTWSYEDPKSWSSQYPKCGGSKQSPIQLETNSSITGLVPPIIFLNYGTTLSGKLTLRNNGHSVEMQIPNTIVGIRPIITGGFLRGKYEAVSLHFHWGSPGAKGSEHSIDGNRYDAEMHVVHKNLIYETLDEASNHKDGIAVFGIMFKITEEPDRYYPGLSHIFSKLSSVVEPGSETTLQHKMALSQVLGDINVKQFLAYSGSLTTPPCAEAVTWTVFPQPLPITLSDLSQFWHLLDSHNNTLINNYRPIQPTNGRPVMYRRGLNNPVFPPFSPFPAFKEIK